MDNDCGITNPYSNGRCIVADDEANGKKIIKIINKFFYNFIIIYKDSSASFTK